MVKPEIQFARSAQIHEDATENRIEAAVEQTPGAQPERRGQGVLGQALPVPKRNTGNKTQQERADD